MSTGRKRDIDAAVQRIIDDVTARRSDLPTGQIRTAADRRPRPGTAGYAVS